jgi:peroxiredoxin
MMLADGGADFAKAIGAEMDTKDFGGIRLRRLAMLVNVSISCIQSFLERIGTVIHWCCVMLPS